MVRLSQMIMQVRAGHNVPVTGEGQQKKTSKVCVVVSLFIPFSCLILVPFFLFERVVPFSYTKALKGVPFSCNTRCAVFVYMLRVTPFY